ncbi:MAG: hypothetical protein ACRC33_23280, partial [Gemmataceae bacterium]
TPLEGAPRLHDSIIRISHGTARLFVLFIPSIGSPPATVYQRAGVPFYAIADFRSDEPLDLHLFGYRLTPKGYEQVSEDERGWLWLEPAGVWLAGVGGLLRCMDQAGSLIASHDEALQKNEEFKAKLEQIEGAMESEVSARHDAQREAREAAERAEQERKGRLDAEAQLRAALAELERLKGSA